MYVKVASPQIDEADVDSVKKALLSGRLTSGPMVKEFEEKFAEYIGTKFAVAVNSGTAALHACLAACNVGFGDEVIVPALTFFSTVTSVIHAGAIPVFCDISIDNFCLDTEDIENKITKQTKAIIPVHYFGHCAEMNKINQIAKKYSLKVIEDCAQAHGSAYYGKKVGSIGDLGAFSMFATKHMTTGEGGVITTDDEAWVDYIQSFRSHGMKGRNDHVLLGYNYRMPEMAGALGLSQLNRLDALNAMRIRNSEKLINVIKDIDWLTVPIVPEHITHTYFWCHILVDEGKLGMPTMDLIDALKEAGIETRNRYIEPLYKQPLLNENKPEILKKSTGDRLVDYKNLYLPNVERAAGKVIGLPNRPDISDKEIEYIAGKLHSL